MPDLLQRLRRTPRSATVLLAFVATTIPIGCGDDRATRHAAHAAAPPSHDELLVSRRVREFLAAMERDDDARACSTMTPKLRRAITVELRIESVGGTCRSHAADIYSPAKAPGNVDARIVGIRVDGDRATATVTARSTGELATGTAESDVLLERLGDGWWVADF